MKRKSGERGSAAVAFTFALFLVVFTAVTVYLFLAKTWWFPPTITAFGAEYDAQFHRTLLITGTIFVLAQLGLALVIFRSRDHGQKVSFFEGNSTMEFIWTLATIVMFVGLGLYGEHAWAEAHFQGEAPGALEVEITGQQFNWNFRYAGPDGKWALISGLGAGAAGISLVVMDASTRKEVKQLNLGGGAAGILITPDSSRAYVAVSTNDKVAVVDLKTLEVAGQISPGKQPDGLAWAVRK